MEVFKEMYDNVLAVAKEEMNRLNQSKPEPRPHRNPSEEIKRWPSRTVKIARTLLSSMDSHSCKLPLNQLQPIVLSEMEVPKVHEGKFLICKIVGKPIADFPVETLIQDLNGDVEKAVIYNFRYNLDDVEWAAPGTIMIIKEPFLRYFSEIKTPSLRIDSPTDIIIVDPADDELLNKVGAIKWYQAMSKDAEVWRQKGNDCFKKGKYDDALMFYDRGIRCNPDLSLLYLNKALTYLKTGAFYYAYEAAKFALEKGGDREKALYRMGQAAYGMREWRKASIHFLEVLKEFPKNVDASEQFKRTTFRLKEEKNGSFDFKALFIEFRKEYPQSDVADFKGSIEIANIPGKGRGITASKDIKKGDLIAVSKALSGSHSKDFTRTKFAAKNNMQNDSRCFTEFMQIIQTMQIFKKNPQLAKVFYELYDGENDTVKKEEIPFGVVDAASVEKICVLNRFGSGNFNDSNKNDHCHMYILPSYFNHSCLANCRHDNNGDVIIVRATMNIKKGEEICISYVHPLEEYSERNKSLTSWNFTCHCQLCEVDSKDKFCAERFKMFKEFEIFAQANSSQASVIKGEQVLKKIRESYVNRNQFKIRLSQTLHLLAVLYLDVGNARKAIKYMEEAISILEDSLKYPMDLPRMEYYLSNFYAALKNMPKALEIYDRAVESSFCVDEEHFDMCYSVKHQL